MAKILTKAIKIYVTCSQFNAAPPKHLMGGLPKELITLSNPFNKTGLDLFGTFIENEQKCYAEVLVCFTTEVHLEIVEDLSKDACVTALKRCIGCRSQSNCIVEGLSKAACFAALKCFYQLAL